MTDKKSRGLSPLQIKVDVDVSEALTGLKSLQREAKKATQELRELESYTGGNVPYEDAKKILMVEYGLPEPLARDCVASRRMSEMDVIFTFLRRYGTMLNTYKPHCDATALTTEQLQRELSKREGVTTYDIAPHGVKASLVIDEGHFDQVIPIEGPAIVTVNID